LCISRPLNDYIQYPKDSQVFEDDIKEKFEAERALRQPDVLNGGKQDLSQLWNN
jgi:hypothetical protein